MPIDTTKPKAVFNPEEDAAMRNEAAKEVVKLLRVRGMEKADAERIVTKHLGRIVTLARVGGHILQVKLLDGTTASQGELRLFVSELEREALLDSFGARPEETLSERLVIGGYEPEEAERLARRHVSRESDGRIRVAHPGGREEFSALEEDAPTYGDKILNFLADSLVRQLERRAATGGAAPSGDYAALGTGSEPSAAGVAPIDYRI